MQIHDCVKRGDIAGVARQLANGIDVNAVEQYSLQTPLMCAVISADADTDMLRFLARNGANVNAAGGEFQQTVLSLAVQSGNLDKVRFLLDVGSNIHCRRPNGYSALIDAMYDRNISKAANLIPILNLLIERGAKVNRVNGNGESALEVASRVGRFDAVKVLLAAGADPTQLEWTGLMHEIALGSLDGVKALLDQDADLSARDRCDRTPWLLSLQVGDLDKAKLLLLSGADPSDWAPCGKLTLMYPIEHNRADILEWLIEEGFDIEATAGCDITPLMMAAEYGATDCVDVLLRNGANPSRVNISGETAIKIASDIPIVRMLVQAGEDLSDISDEARQLLLGVGGQDLQVSQEQYLAGRYRRFGNKNPELMEVDFWKAMIRCNRPAYVARDSFAQTNNCNEPVWGYQRFGRTITELPDGRIVEIAGEHEDYYDSNFCIYNDVVVYQSDDTFKIFGYPKNIFPPTDFHTATLVGNHIYIIGNLGYQNERIHNETPVYRLYCDTFRIEKIETTGDKPGWISRHKAYYKESAKIYVTGGKIATMMSGKEKYIENSVNYTLDLTNLSWSHIDA
ncbi:ankyrin repeat domain-containing protein [Leptolyngbya sp. FACHB-261]|uniref:ankyrin repeat domain-containing protein n=1 Tax=Leptolyngbya sp. FACHB-261 TaxID=2692806 RepID=UPI001687EE1D|nr:ankyrin repeat domain-containing protein [Leptolyngbya sp. FACHB-261]MBD2103598.1 ankyrin repeat domain-containing protein [Leptolyngbya sp. FACHB-261]